MDASKCGFVLIVRSPGVTPLFFQVGKIRNERFNTR